MAANLEEEFKILEHKLMQLKLDYERYFLGSRPREPVLLRAEVQKQIAIHSNQSIKNTALRFRFSSICSRFQAFKRHWIETLRKMEQGSYSRHKFKADLHSQQDPPPPPQVAAENRAGSGGSSLFEQYVQARRSCGQDVSGLSPEKLEAILERQQKSLRERYGSSEFRFKVVVEDGRAKLKARRA